MPAASADEARRILAGVFYPRRRQYDGPLRVVLLADQGQLFECMTCRSA